MNWPIFCHIQITALAFKLALLLNPSQISEVFESLYDRFKPNIALVNIALF